MKFTLTFLAYFLAATTASFAGGGPLNRASITLQTQGGLLSFASPNIPGHVDALGNVYFEFKPNSFTSASKADDAKLYDLFQENNYRTVVFKGVAQKSLASLKVGGTLSTTAVGKLNFAGTMRGMTIPITVTKIKEGAFMFSTSALFDWSANPNTKAQGTAMQLQGPIRFALSPILN
jgi:hypothetical protein